MFRSERRIQGARSGFSLLEVLFAVVILAVLVAVAVPIYANTRKNAEKKTCASNIRAIASAESKYLFEKDVYTATIGDLNAYGLGNTPQCPAKDGSGNPYSYTLAGGGAGADITISCADADHASNTMTLKFPPIAQQ